MRTPAGQENIFLKGKIDEAGSLAGGSPWSLWGGEALATAARVLSPRQMLYN